MSRTAWTWLGAGLLGLAAGVTYAWMPSPQGRAGAYPASLRSDFKDEFRNAIASAYSVTGNLERAEARLQLLGDPDPIAGLSAQAQRVLAAGQSFQQAQQLARLASDLQAGVSSIPRLASTPTFSSAASPSPGTHTAQAPIDGTNAGPPEATTTAQQSLDAGAPSVEPILTPRPSSQVPFELVSREDTCDPRMPPGLMQITVMDARGEQLPGMEIAVAWGQGEERFFTGLQSEFGNGYADFVMQADTTYSIQIARAGAPASGLSAPVCRGDGAEEFRGGLRLVFMQP